MAAETGISTVTSELWATPSSMHNSMSGVAYRVECRMQYTDQLASNVWEVATYLPLQLAMPRTFTPSRTSRCLGMYADRSTEHLLQ